MNNVVFYDRDDQLVRATPPAQLVECLTQGVRDLLAKSGATIHHLGGGWLVDMQVVGVTRWFCLVTNSDFKSFVEPNEIRQRADQLFYHTPTVKLETMDVKV